MLRLVLLAILLLVLFLLLLRVRLRIAFEGELTVTLRVLFVRYRLYPVRRKLNLKEFSARGIARKLKKDRARIQNEQKKQQKKAEQGKKEKKPGKDMGDLLALLDIVRDVLLALKKHFLAQLRIDVARLQLTVASPDAARTAIEYGIAVQSVQYIVALLEQLTRFRVRDNMSIRVDCDYLRQSPAFALDITASVRVARIIAALISAAGAYLIASSKHKQKNSKEINHGGK